MEAASQIESSVGSRHLLWDWNSEAKTLVVAVHGFTGRGSDFALCADLTPKLRWVAPDVVGHHADGSLAIVPQGELSETLSDLLASYPAKRRVLMGYSMGGRIALSTLLHDPSRVDALVLVGATAGIDNEEDRKRRRLSDAALAERARKNGPEAFMDDWRRHPLIRSQANIPEPWGERLRASRETHTAEDLAQCLETYGQGELPPLWNKLSAFTGKALIVSGENDPRYRDLLPRFQKHMPQADTMIVPNAGHAAHLEAPEAFAELLTNWLEGSGQSHK